MKKLTVFSTLLLLVSCLAYGQNTISFYGQDFKASEILGNGRSWGPRAAILKTSTITKPQGLATLNEILGAYYRTQNFNGTNELLNMSIDEDIPILDSINFSFYNAWAFLNVLDKDAQIRANPNYSKFKAYFKAAKTNHLRRAILYSDENEIFRSALEAARFTFYQQPIAITASTTIARSFRLGVSANIAAAIKPSAKFKVDVNTAIRDSVDKYVNVTGGRYHEIRLQQDYISRASKILTGIYKTDSAVSKYGDVFADELRIFFRDKEAAIVTGAAVFEAQFDYSKIKKLELALGAMIKANADLSKEIDAPKLAASATAQFNRTADKQTGVTTAQVYYPIRLVRDIKLEIGAGAPK